VPVPAVTTVGEEDVVEQAPLVQVQPVKAYPVPAVAATDICVL
jgi:hypothetical protein